MTGGAAVVAARRAGAGALAALAAGGLAACESTADKSAAIAAQGRAAVRGGGALKITRNRDVRVVRSAVVRGAGGAVAVAVQLRNAGARAQRDVPVLIDVRDARGASVYSNAVVGLQPALQRLTLIRGRSSAWWVNDQVTASAPPRAVRVRAGAAKAAVGPPRVALTGVHFDADATGRFLTGTVVNRARSVLRQVPIFAVAIKGGTVVAAGRSLVPKLPAAGAPKPTHFRLFFVGEPRGARLALTVAPTPAPS
ncbi:MAG TPA: hypothetical protein VGO71_10260 [Baekduia sp.]|nr:hypothetical protein [Baekduia sp.]